MNKRQKLLLKWFLWGGLFSLTAILILIYMPKPEDPGALVEGTKVAGLTNKLGRDITDDKVSLDFSEVADEAGLNFKHFNDERQSLLPEDMGSGMGWADYNNDGLVDLYVANFAHSISTELVLRAELQNTTDDTKTSSQLALSQFEQRSGKLYKNLGNGKFKDVTEAAGLLQHQFGNGVSWGDYNNDGYLDLYLTHYGTNQLFENDTRGGFIDVTMKAGVGDDRFSAGSSWGDFDGDGWLDLYVTNYVDFKTSGKFDEASSKQNEVDVSYRLNPSAYSPVSNALFHNNKDGTFTNVAVASKVDNPTGRSMGALWMDFNNDGMQDLYVANDVSANGVFLNKGNGEFEDIGASSLAADYRGAMGLASGDLDRDGDQEIFVTHWLAQENAFFLNMFADGFEDDQGNWRLFFMDDADTLGLGQISLKTVGWATGMVDLNNNGLLDLWVVNGDTLEEVVNNKRQLKAQPIHIFQNQLDKGFFEIAEKSLAEDIPRLVGRGGAHADYDNDGQIDIAIMGHGEKIRLLKNTSKTKYNWLGLKLRQKTLNRFAIGARVEVITAGKHQYFQSGTENTYLSQNDMTIHIGLETSDLVEQLKVYWPDLSSSEYVNLEANKIHTLVHQDSYSPR